MRKAIWILLCVTAGFLAGCHGQTNQAGTVGTGLEPGKVTHKVSVLADATLSYALYLPSGYTAGSRYPVMIAFDPSGDGLFPVERYKGLAEKYGFILLGSYDSKNGLGLENVERVGRAMYAEAESRFKADSSTIYLAGFSGGARVACITGLYVVPVRGIVGCGAGFPGMTRKPVYGFDYFMIVGSSDFNLSELIDLDEQLTSVSWNHQLLIYNGSHNWAPVDIMDKAFAWFKGAPPLSPPAVSYSALYDIPKEKAQRQILFDGFYDKDTLWWDRQITKLKNQVKTGKTANDTLIPKRLLQFVGMMAYSKVNLQLNTGMFKQAEKSLVIYRLAEPDNPAVDSLWKVLNAKWKR
jgi:predicted esterase